MKVSFGNLYRLPGTFETQKDIRGEAISTLRNIKLESFLEDTKPFRSKSGYSFYDNKTGDYYIAVSDRHNSMFEYTASDYNIAYENMGSKLVRNDVPASEEVAALYNRRYS